MTNITQKLYTYETDKFFPVYEGDKLVNRSEFVAYKAGQVAREVGYIAYKAIEIGVTYIDEMVQASKNRG